MIQSTAAHRSRPTVQQSAQYHAEWTEFYPLARWLVKRKLGRLDGTIPHDISDRVNEAIAHAWQEYPKLRQRRPDIPAKTAIRWVCRTGVSRVWSNTRFVPKPHPSYVDALDRKDIAALDEFPQLDREGYRDTDNRSCVEALIANLPVRLQPVARLLSYGMPKRMVAQRRGISPSTLYALIDDLRRHLA